MAGRKHSSSSYYFPTPPPAPIRNSRKEPSHSTSSSPLSTSPATSIYTATSSSSSSSSSNPHNSQENNLHRKPTVPFKVVRKVRQKTIQQSNITNSASPHSESPTALEMASLVYPMPDPSRDPYAGPSSSADYPTAANQETAAFPAYPEQRERTTIVVNESWRQLPETRVNIYRLPDDATTLDIWSLLKEFGEIEEIEIGDRDGRPNGRAWVRFRPPPAIPFWQDGSLSYKDTRGQRSKINIELKPQDWESTVRSPINPAAVYPDRMSVPLKSLDFGFMVEETTMMAMFTTSQPTKTNMSFEVNLHRRLLDVRFVVKFNTTEGKPKRRRERYRFKIPFIALSNIHDIESENSDGETHIRSILIPLQYPPQFWRRANDIARTHDKEGRASRWSEWDSWYRQTDIVEDARHLESEPIAIRKKKPTIDIGRWTTYKLLFDLGDDKIKEFDRMVCALRDFNIPKSPIPDFKLVQDHQERVWDAIDPPPAPVRDDSYLDLIMQDCSRTFLSFALRYQLEACISQGCVSEYNMTKDFIDELVEMESRELGSAVKLLESIVDRGNRYYNPMDILQAKRPSRSKAHIPSYCVEIRKATITPTMVYYANPTVETSNRIIRHFFQHQDRFLRVQFTDEKLHGKVSATEEENSNEIFTRVKRTMLNGIIIGDHHFKFLAFGNSQMRQHGAYFFCEAEDLKCDDIRKWMGDFEGIKVIAKYAARIGQCFSTTRAMNGFKVHKIEIPDVERNGFCFTDGCGTISQSAAQLIASELRLSREEPVPSAFQFRLGGCKGVLAVDPKLKKGESDFASFQVCIRPSQQKFDAAHNILEIIRCSAYSSATLNRQLIQVLSDLGLDDHVFLNKLEHQLRDLNEAVVDQKTALGLLRKQIDPNQATLRIARLIIDGFMSAQEPFVMCLLHLWRAWSIKMLKEKARIAIDNGCFLFGVVDETATLKGHFKEDHKEMKEELRRGGKLRLDLLPQIFVQIPDFESKGFYKVITGPCLLARNPSLHPGDLRVVNAVDAPELRHLKNVVVLPQTGSQPIANMCSGGDLDGDDYIVIWDGAFIPPRLNQQPMDFSPPPPMVTEDGKVTVSDITTFFVTYMKNDTLGSIANAHLATADKQGQGVFSPQCLKLAELHSLAVDFPKTGVSAKMTKDLRIKKWPHFFEKKHENPNRIYQSTCILGQLYDAVDKVAFRPDECVAGLQFDDRILHAFNDINEEMLNIAKDLKTKYDDALHRIMAQHDICTEFEVWSTFVLSHSTIGSDYKFHEDMLELSQGLLDRFDKTARLSLRTEDEYTIGRFAAAMYIITNEEYTRAMEKHQPLPFISFPWIYANLLGKIAEGEGIFARDPTTGVCVPPAPEIATLMRFTVETRNKGKYKRQEKKEMEGHEKDADGEGLKEVENDERKIEEKGGSDNNQKDEAQQNEAIVEHRQGNEKVKEEERKEVNGKVQTMSTGDWAEGLPTIFTFTEEDLALDLFGGLRSGNKEQVADQGKEEAHR
ncbi:hypothetical protein ABW19_dt0209484 [Dactylella cylindrospora]|nr:hypothetical protein ABW19_dt0209484 [Dactylella cylindrospora]